MDWSTLDGILLPIGVDAAPDNKLVRLGGSYLPLVGINAACHDGREDGWFKIMPCLLEGLGKTLLLGMAQRRETLSKHYDAGIATAGSASDTLRASN